MLFRSVENKYSEYVEDLTAKASKDANTRLEKDTGKSTGAKDQNNTAAADTAADG